MDLKADNFIKDCKVTKEDWQTYLDRGTLEHIVANMLITYSQDQVKKLNIDDVSNQRELFDNFYEWLDGLTQAEYDDMSLTDKIEKYFFKN